MHVCGRRHKVAIMTSALSARGGELAGVSVSCMSPNIARAAGIMRLAGFTEATRQPLTDGSSTSNVLYCNCDPIYENALLSRLPEVGSRKILGYAFLDLAKHHPPSTGSALQSHQDTDVSVPCSVHQILDLELYMTGMAKRRLEFAITQRSRFSAKWIAGQRPLYRYRSSNNRSGI